MDSKLDIFITELFILYIDQLQKVRNIILNVVRYVKKKNVLFLSLYKQMASTKYSRINKYCKPITLFFLTSYKHNIYNLF